MSSFTPTTNQHERFRRSIAVLDAKRIPRLSMPLYTEDDAEVVPRTAEDAARRILILWAIALCAEGMPQREALEMLDRRQLWPWVSPEETRYIRDPNPTPHQSAAFVWRLEAVWVLAWALGRLDDLGWPAFMCDVPRLADIMSPIETDPAFTATATLRTTSDILDAQDLTMRLHWAIRDAWINKRMIRSDMDWTAGQPDVRTTSSAGVGVVEQRHKTLNWIIRFDNADWDQVDTPT
jgi:hypothetical protein